MLAHGLVRKPSRPHPSPKRYFYIDISIHPTPGPLLAYANLSSRQPHHIKITSALFSLSSYCFNRVFAFFVFCLWSEGPSELQYVTYPDVLLSNPSKIQHNADAESPTPCFVLFEETATPSESRACPCPGFQVTLCCNEDHIDDVAMNSTSECPVRCDGDPP